MPAAVTEILPSTCSTLLYWFPLLCSLLQLLLSFFAEPFYFFLGPRITFGHDAQAAIYYR